MPTPTRSNTIDFDAAKLQRLGFAGKRRPSPKPVTLGELRRQLNMHMVRSYCILIVFWPFLLCVLGV